ncbi:hypothetical protein evm_014734 [Chilo suppressalis]|nr:hypothetical protein evm_014734 [Chilo suppressalis]
MFDELRVLAVLVMYFGVCFDLFVVCHVGANEDKPHQIRAGDSESIKKAPWVQHAPVNTLSTDYDGLNVIFTKHGNKTCLHGML